MSFIERNVRYTGVRRASAWRTIAIGMWSEPTSPTAMARIDIDAEPMRAFLAAEQAAGRPASVHAYIVRAVARALALHPQCNTTLRLGRIYQRADVNVFVQVSVDHKGSDLDGVLLREADRKPLAELSRELLAGARAAQRHQNPEHTAGQQTFERLPGVLSRPLLSLLSTTLYTLNIWSPLLGVPRDGFGSVSVSFLSAFDVQSGYGPLDPHFRCPLTFAVGPVRKAPAVRDDAVIAREQFWMTMCFDHRLFDGVAAARLGMTLRRLLEHPEAG